MIDFCNNLILFSEFSRKNLLILQNRCIICRCYIFCINKSFGFGDKNESKIKFGDIETNSYNNEYGVVDKTIVGNVEEEHYARTSEYTYNYQYLLKSIDEFNNEITYDYENIVETTDLKVTNGLIKSITTALSKEEYSYNDQELLAEIKYLTTNNNLLSKHIYTYNNYGLIETVAICTFSPI